MLPKFIDNAREDSLTASVFSHLLHLTSEQFWRILSRACYTNNLPDCPGEPQLIAWPNWNPAGTGNSDRVIPDLFIRFKTFDLIIEAKIADDGTQDPEQWRRELIAYTNEFGKEKRSVRMIALGGIHSENDVEIRQKWSESTAESGGASGETHTFICIVHMCRWRSILIECQRLKMELEVANKQMPTSRTLADIRILNDLIAFFATHRYTALRWFKDFNFKSILLDPSVDSDQHHFRNVSRQFQRS